MRIAIGLYERFTSLDVMGWKEEVKEMTLNYAQFGNRLPKPLIKKLEELRQVLDSL